MKTLKIVEKGHDSPCIFIVSKKEKYVEIDSCIFPYGFVWRLDKEQAKLLRNWITRAMKDLQQGQPHDAD